MITEHAARRHSSLWRTLLRVLLAGIWVFVLLVGVLYATEVADSDSNCPVSPEVSTYGTAGWSVLPPGPTCTFTAEAHGIDEVRGPTPVMSVWLGLLGLGAVVFVATSPRVRMR